MRVRSFLKQLLEAYLKRSYKNTKLIVDRSNEVFELLLMTWALTRSLPPNRGLFFVRIQHLASFIGAAIGTGMVWKFSLAAFGAAGHTGALDFLLGPS